MALKKAARSTASGTRRLAFVFLYTSGFCRLHGSLRIAYWPFVAVCCRVMRKRRSCRVMPCRGANSVKKENRQEAHPASVAIGRKAQPVLGTMGARYASIVHNLLSSVFVLHFNGLSIPAGCAQLAPGSGLPSGVEPLT